MIINVSASNYVRTIKLRSLKNQTETEKENIHVFGTFIYKLYLIDKFSAKLRKLTQIEKLPEIPKIPTLPPKRLIRSEADSIANYDPCEIYNVCLNGGICRSRGNE